MIEIQCGTDANGNVIFVPEEQLVQAGLMKRPVPQPTFRPDYNFLGLPQFVERACEAVGVPLDLRGRAKGGWFVTAIGNSLSQLPKIALDVQRGAIPATALGESLARIADIQKALAAQVHGIEAAIEEVFAGCGIDDSEPLPVYPHPTATEQAEAARLRTEATWRPMPGWQPVAGPGAAARAEAAALKAKLDVQAAQVEELRGLVESLRAGRRK